MISLVLQRLQILIRRLAINWRLRRAPTMADILDEFERAELDRFLTEIVENARALQAIAASTQIRYGDPDQIDKHVRAIRFFADALPDHVEGERRKGNVLRAGHDPGQATGTNDVVNRRRSPQN